jgi:hypothetical protein
MSKQVKVGPEEAAECAAECAGKRAGHYYTATGKCEYNYHGEENCSWDPLPSYPAPKAETACTCGVVALHNDPHSIYCSAHRSVKAQKAWHATGAAKPLRGMAAGPAILDDPEAPHRACATLLATLPVSAEFIEANASDDERACAAAMQDLRRKPCDDCVPGLSARLEAAESDWKAVCANMDGRRSRALQAEAALENEFTQTALCTEESEMGTCDFRSCCSKCCTVHGGNPAYCCDRSRRHPEQPPAEKADELATARTLIKAINHVIERDDGILTGLAKDDGPWTPKVGDKVEFGGDPTHWPETGELLAVGPHVCLVDDGAVERIVRTKGLRPAPVKEQEVTVWLHDNGVGGYMVSLEDPNHPGEPDCHAPVLGKHAFTPGVK